MKQLVAMTLLLAAFSVAAPFASAKSLSRILADSGLTPADFDMVQNSAKTLYDTPNHKPGQNVDWSNPESGAHGSAQLKTVRGNCAYILHKVYVRDATRPRELRTEYCQSADGEWLLQP